MNFEKLENIIGFVVFIAIIRYLVRKMIQQTETKVISDEGLNLLEDPEKKNELRKVVDQYHKTGDWSQTELQNIL